MNQFMRGWLLALIGFAFGMFAGAFGWEYFSAHTARDSAKAELYASGLAKRNGSLDTAMRHAQRAHCLAPESYDALEAIGDLYAASGDGKASARSYEEALDLLKTRGSDAMLVGAPEVSAETAAAHVSRKLDGTKNADVPSERKTLTDREQ